MSQQVAIQYRDFYDIPRMFVVDYNGLTILFDGSFDERLDDYPDQYDVSLLPRLSQKELDGSWERLRERAVQRFGNIPTSAVRFDPTARKTIDVEVLKNLLAGRSTRETA
jgi:hypothetical protein